MRPEAVTATVLWTTMAWAQEGATHSPILAAISVEPDSGKSTLLGVLRFLVPKPFVSVEPTGPSVYRTVDREHPTLIIDEADDLFYRKSDLRAIVNAGWSRGTRIPRQGRWYDPFCPKILGILGKTKLPRTIASRSIILKMWPKKPDEKAEDFAYADDAEFSTIRRKLARWASDNVRIIKDLKPPQPPGFNNRLSANWKLPLQIAQHAGGGWPEQASRSAIYLSRTPTAATSSARVPSVSDDDAQNWRCRWGRVAEIWGADRKVVASRLCALRASTSAVRQTDRLRGAAHPVVNIRTSPTEASLDGLRELGQIKAHYLK